ncbi:sphingomyelin phosphodiesterase-like, partial [Pollicipes pollicipes]|uniref:sphingomyelin phosphodiesterase-like n=1 Tax=Pollicipes pollicipes TaxID=41117 RepID=UPI0018852359
MRIVTLLVPLLVLLLAASSTATAGKLFDKVRCSSCKAVGGLVVGLVRLTGSSSLLRSKAKLFCGLVPVARTVCVGYIDSWAESLTYIVRNSPLSASDMCALYLKSCARRPLEMDVKLELPEPSTAALRRRLENYPAPSTPGLKVLHIADLHLDEQYAEGADNSCPEVLCCRAENGTSSTGP